VEQAPLSQQITATANVYTEPVVIGLDPGESMRLEDLLYGLLLTSGNDAAIAIAEGIGDTLPRFVGMMNAKAEKLGLKNTRFLNPHGLDAPGHYSTALDLARLTAAMMREPTLARVVGARDHTVAGPPLYMFRSSNPLLGRYDGVDGGKTGFTDLAGRCLAVSATRAGHQVVAVMLDSDNIALDGQRLLDHAFGNYEWVPVSADSALTAEYRVGTQRRELRLAGNTLVPLAHEEPRTIRGYVVLDGDLSAPVGRVGQLIVESPLGRLGQFGLSSQEPTR
jgi:D-alanyl-D-alanine carboxypeptidase